MRSQLVHHPIPVAIGRTEVAALKLTRIDHDLVCITATLAPDVRTVPSREARFGVSYAHLFGSLGGRWRERGRHPNRLALRDREAERNLTRPAERLDGNLRRIGQPRALDPVLANSLCGAARDALGAGAAPAQQPRTRPPSRRAADQAELRRPHGMQRQLRRDRVGGCDHERGRRHGNVDATGLDTPHIKLGSGNGDAGATPSQPSLNASSGSAVTFRGAGHDLQRPRQPGQRQRERPVAGHRSTTRHGGSPPARATVT